MTAHNHDTYKQPLCPKTAEPEAEIVSDCHAKSVLYPLEKRSRGIRLSHTRGTTAWRGELAYVRSRCEASMDSVDREVVLPRAQTPIVVCGPNRERKAA